MLEIEDVIELLRDNPEYVEILQRAVELEQKLQEEAFLFNWDDIPGESEERFKDFLHQQFYQDWIKDAIVSKPSSSIIYVRDISEQHVIVIKPNLTDQTGTMTSAIATINDDSNLKYQFDDIQYHADKLKLYRSNYVMWEWHDVRAAPQSIKKMILAGIVKVAYKTNKTTEYVLVDRDVIKAALKQIELDQDIADFESNQPIYPEQVVVPADAFDIIVGYDDVKSIILKGLKSDKPVNVLFIGAPGTAKSMFLEELNRIPGSSYHLGSSSTKAGLTEFLFDIQPRILLIDELEKMDRKDYAVLLSLMEGGKVTETKKGRHREIKLDTIVFAACNSTGKIPLENMSRFHFEFVFQPYTHAEFEDVVQRILVTREGIDQNLAGYIAGKMSSITQDPRKAVGLARICTTTDDVDQAIETKLKYKM